MTGLAFLGLIMLVECWRFWSRGWKCARAVRVLGDLRAADWIFPLGEPFERPEPRTGRIDLGC